MLDYSTKVAAWPNPLEAIDELCVALYGEWLPEAVFVILKAFIDDAGSHKDSPVAVLGCFVSPATRWNGFDAKWNRLLAANDLTFYRTKPFKDGSGEFQGWSDQRKGRFLSAAVPIIKEHATFGFSVAVKRSDYHEHYRRDGAPRGDRLDSINGLLFRRCLGYIPARCREIYPNDPPKIAFILEVGTGSSDCQRIFSDVKAERTEAPEQVRQSLRAIALMTKTDAPALQAADAMATNAFWGERGGEPELVARGADATFADDMRASGGLPLYREDLSPALLADERAEIDARAAERMKRRSVKKNLSGAV